MLQRSNDSEDPSSTHPQKTPSAGSVFARFKTIFKSKPDPTLREALEGFMDEPGPHNTDLVTSQERALLSNILELRDIKVVDVMVPRTDIIAIREDISQEELLNLLAQKQVSRLPVYRDTLDDVLGTVHIKDVLGALAQGKHINIEEMLTEIPIVSPAMSVLNLILEMRENRRHMALVVDEFGGIDGLVTIGDVIEAIIGEIDDEHDNETPLQMQENPDGSILADARLDLEDFEERYGSIFTEEEHEENDTLGGLVCFIAGHVPARGEVIKHPSGMVFEVRDADPRRVHLIKIKNLP